MRTSPDRRRFLQIAGAAGIAGLAGCTSGGGNGSGNDSDGSNGSGGSNGSAGSNGSSGNGSNATGNASGGSSGGSDVNVGMVYATGGLGDNSFNDMAHRGIEKAAKKLGIEYNQAQPEAQSDFSTFQRRFAKSSDPDYELIFAIGFAQTSALKEISKSFGDQNFTIIDSVVEQPNVASYVFKEHVGSFQVGHLAGLLTTREMSAGAGKTNPDNVKLGFVGGQKAPLIKKFQAGFEKGAYYANGDASVDVAYVGSFTEPGTAKETAISMYDTGADIVYHAAGASGLGVFQAAQEKGRYAIGVDSAQSRAVPKFADVILASMVKRVNRAVFKSTKNVVNGNFNGGKVTTLGLEQNGVEAVYGKELGSAIPKEVKQSLKQSREKIISGEITVPQKPEKVEK